MKTRLEYYTIKDIEEIVSCTVVEVYTENRWIVVVLDSGVRVKIKNF